MLIFSQDIPARHHLNYLKMVRRGSLILQFFSSSSFGYETQKELRLKNQALTINFNTCY